MIGTEKEGFPVKKLLAVFLVFALLLTGCSGVSEAIDDASIRPLAQALLDSFVADDLAGCRALLDENVSDEQLEAYFSAIHLELKDLGPYEMTAVSWNRNITDEEDLTSIRYLIEAENMKLYLMVSMFTGSDRLSGFKLEDAENTAEPTLPMGPVHWIFLAVGAAVLGFVIWMFVDCARRKMKRKWLWLPLILLGALVLTLVCKNGGINFNFRIGLYLGLTNLTTFVRGGFRVMLYVPLGAIVYFFQRKALTIRTESENVLEAAACDEVIDA